MLSGQTYRTGNFLENVTLVNHRNGLTIWSASPPEILAEYAAALQAGETGKEVLYRPQDIADGFCHFIGADLTGAGKIWLVQLNLDARTNGLPEAESGSEMLPGMDSFDTTNDQEEPIYATSRLTVYRPELERLTPMPLDVALMYELSMPQTDSAYRPEAVRTFDIGAPMRQTMYDYIQGKLRKAGIALRHYSGEEDTHYAIFLDALRIRNEALEARVLAE